MKHLLTLIAAVLCALPASSCAQGTTIPPSLRVLSSNGVRAPLEDARAAIEAAIGYALDIEFSTSASLTQQIEAGEPFDVAILTPVLVDRLATGGFVATEPRPSLARTGVGVGARTGEVAADNATLEGFKTLLLEAESVAFTAEGQSRRTTEAAFARLGIAEAMLAKALIVGPGEAPQAVAAGKAELVLTLVSEILPVPGLELVGAYPEEIQGYVTFAAAIGANSRDRGASERLLEQLAAPVMSAALRARGLEALGP